VIGVFRIASRDMAGDSLFEPEPSEETECDNQPLLAMPPLFRDILENLRRS
jgi:hypothetical protein